MLAKKGNQNTIIIKQNITVTVAGPWRRTGKGPETKGDGGGRNQEQE